ncbi:MAG: response regulator transcription factor [Lentimicrobiaceae bacterium]|nr:response regulator transcription factor [Lentimicrobiaceae bacterium]
MKNNKILIVETSPLISSGLSSFFEGMNQFTVSAVVDNMEDLQDKMVIHNPDILIINPIMIGYYALNNFFKNLSQNYPNIHCVALVTTYIDKNILRYFKEIVELSDNKQKVVNKLINLLNNSDETTSQENIELSNREIDVLVSVAKGMTNKEISDLLSISVHTVITHRKNIVKKTGIKSVAGLTVYALLNNLVEESEIN